MTQFYQQIQARVYEFLTIERDRTYLRRLQFSCLGITLLLVTAALSYTNLGDQSLEFAQNEEGEWDLNSNAPNDVLAVRTFEFLDQARLEEARERAARNTPLYFTRDFSMPLRKTDDQQPGDQAPAFQEALQKDVEALEQCRPVPAADQSDCIRERVAGWPRLSRADTRELFSRSPETIQDNLGKLVNLLYRENIILAEPVSAESSSDQIIVISYNPGSDLETTPYAREVTMLRRDLNRPAAQERFNSQASVGLQTLAPELAPVLVRVATAYLRKLESVNFSQKETAKARESAVEKIKPTEYTVKYEQNGVILKKGEPITPLKFRALQEHNQAQIRVAFSRTFAILFQQIIFLFLLVYFLKRYAKHYIGKVKSNLIFFLTLWMFVILLLVQRSAWVNEAQVNLGAHFFGAWVPIGLFVILFSLMFREAVAIPIAIYMALLVFVASEYDDNSLVIALVIGILAGILGRKIQRRTHFISTAALLAGAKLALLIAGYFYTDRNILALEESIFTAEFLAAAQITLLSGLSAMAAILILPVYEAVFNQPTRFKLAELADPSHPLLQELFQRAPSTWTHTLMVAALSEKACERLGLDTLLCRTGVYYHDIGKMKNAGFFVENRHLIPKTENIDKDNPNKAAKVIIDHVLDGIAMARAARLPEEVIAFIPEHHGTSTMAFFYHKALERNRRKVSRSDFRYPGPRPQSKETGIVMIADSLEAASRSLDTFDEESVEALIQRIINMKLAENQLDESGLTMGDLTTVREALKDVLMSSFQYRPKYPSQEKTRELEVQRSNGKGPVKSAGRAKSTRGAKSASNGRKTTSARRR